jgi:hypothetical protein
VRTSHRPCRAATRPAAATVSEICAASSLACTSTARTARGSDAVPFWRAILSTPVVFAGGHAYEARSAVDVVILVSSIGLLGLANGYLVRITGKLAPAIMVHATFNLLAVCVDVARARS